MAFKATRLNGRLPSAHLSLGRDFLMLAPIALAYFAAHFIALLFPDAEKVLAAVWPPGGIGLAALLLAPRRLWPAILTTLFIAGNSANLISGRPLILSAGFMTANVLESAACAWLISRWCGDDVKFVRVKEVLALIAAAIFVNALTSFIGAGTAALTGKAQFWHFWLIWWVSDGLGILLITPLIVTWFKPLGGIQWGRVVEYGAFIAVWCAVSWLSFQVSWNCQHIGFYPYMPIALLAWPALRFGQRSVTLAVVMLAAILLTSTAVSAGPLLWGGQNHEERLLLSQLYLGFAAATGMLLAASHAESISAEQSAQEGQARLRALGDNLPNGMVYQVVQEHDGSMRFLFVSAGVERLNGISADEVLRDPSALYGQIMEEDLSGVAAAEGLSAKDMSVFNVEARLRRPDGQVRWMHLSSSPRRLADGRILWDGVEMDITERKYAETRIRESEEKLQKIIDGSSTVIFVKDLDGKYLLINSLYEKLFHISKCAIVGKTDYDVFPREAAKSFRDADLEVLKANKPLEVDERVPQDDGIHNYISVKFPLYDSEGNPYAVCGIATDITGRKLAEEAIEKSEKKFRDLTESTSDWVWELNENGVFTYSNLQVREIVGYEPEELLGKTPFDYMRPEEARRVVEFFHATTAALKAFNAFENSTLHKDGHEVIIETSGVPCFDTEGRFSGYRGINRDITGRKKVEEHIKQSLREKETLLREIHHRVKNNMAVVSALLSLQARKIKDATVSRLFEESQQRVKSMALVHEKLYQTKDFSSINFEDYIKSLVSEIISLYRIDTSVITTEINIEGIELDLESAVPCGLIINELLTNAFKYAFPDNRGGVLRVDFTKTDDNYTLTIKDNGVGLPEGFDYKEANTLGLQLVNVLTGQIRGTLRIKSDKGTEAVVTFKARGSRY
jgi:PAS domain S-box-containing protein